MSLAPDRKVRVHLFLVQTPRMAILLMPRVLKTIKT